MNAPTVVIRNGARETRQPGRHLCLALAAVDAARVQLDRYAFATDAPAWQAVDAADALDGARALLAQAVANG
jgi:hypothetical protein